MRGKFRKRRAGVKHEQTNKRKVKKTKERKVKLGQAMIDDRLLQNLEHAMGPIAMEALRAPDVLEIMLNPDGRLWLERFGSPMFEAGRMSPQQGRQILSLVASALGVTITRATPVVEGEFPVDGSRIEGTDVPLAPGPSFCIRKKPHKIFSLGEYVEMGIMDAKSEAFLEEAIQQKANILVVGGTGSGKTTLVNGLLEALGRLCPDDRLLVMEDTCEIQASSQNAVFLRTAPNWDMQALTKIIMRYRPDRIVPGEVRDGAALDLLKSWNTGHPGGLATLHANSATEALRRLENLIAERTPSPMQWTIGSAVDIIVYIEKTPKGRRVSEIIYVHGYDAKSESYSTEFILDRRHSDSAAPWYQKYIIGEAA